MVGGSWTTGDWLELAPLRLAAVSAGCAAVMFVGGLEFKTTRWARNPDGSGMGWADGVKPWVGWAVLGGLAILALLGIGWWLERWLVPAAGATAIFARAGMTAADYRNQLETSIVDHPIYTEQSLALGLRVVPALAVVGAVAAGLLALVEILAMTNARRHGSLGSASL